MVYRKALDTWNSEEDVVSGSGGYGALAQYMSYSTDYTRLIK